MACSGEGKGGTLTVLRRSVVPDLITEVPLPGKQQRLPGGATAGRGARLAPEVLLVVSLGCYLCAAVLT